MQIVLNNSASTSVFLPSSEWWVSFLISNSVRPCVRLCILNAARLPPPTPNIVVTTAVLESKPTAAEATAVDPATAATPAAMPGAASPPVSAKRVPATMPADPILTPRTIFSRVIPLSLFFSLSTMTLDPFDFLSLFDSDNRINRRAMLCSRDSNFLAAWADSSAYASESGSPLPGNNPRSTGSRSMSWFKTRTPTFLSTCRILESYPTSLDSKCCKMSNDKHRNPEPGVRDSKNGRRTSPRSTSSGMNSFRED
mmetsp:Transcript_37382/g.90773  ORF Transcript_37382/g.90773 Transcript_37382/m.90773 type:complete len:254 (-) Transcript_37382:971-1732(-)